MLARGPVEVRAMRNLLNQTDGTEPTGPASTAPSMTWEAMQEAPWLSRKTARSQRRIVAEAEGVGRLSLAMGLSSSLSGSLICNLPLSLSSPLQSLNLRSSSIWLSGAENELRTWPPGVRSSEHYRSRKGACRTLNGRLFGPIGRLFLPSGHGLFGMALTALGPCVGQALVSNDRQATDDRLPTAWRHESSSGLRKCA